MKLSVIIPVYRVEQTLGRCVESIIGQTFADFELILVDDGSPDRCPQMCDEFAKNDTRIHVIHKENGGLSDARNAGIDKAKGEYITFVDSDDYLEPDTYKPLMDKLDLQPAIDILEYPVSCFEGSPQHKIVVFSVAEYTDMTDYWLRGNGYEHAYMWNKIFKSSLFHDVRFSKGRVFEDVDIMPRLLARCHTLTTTEKGLYHYCFNPNGITSNATKGELSMLLDSHLSIMQQPSMLHDARYYLHVLNIQMDVCELCDVEPRLPYIPVSPLASNLSVKARLKTIALRILGIRGICYFNKILHKFYRSHS